jgi:hypothetical protein
MAKKPEQPKPAVWTIYKIAAKADRLGTVEAPDEATAIERGAILYVPTYFHHSSEPSQKMMFS